MEDELIKVIEDLIQHKYEEEWFEFKMNWFDRIDTENAVYSAEIPQVDGQIPLVSSEIPQVDSQIPLVSSEIPQVNGQIPLVSSEIPLVDGQIPLVSSEIPPVDDYLLPDYFRDLTEIEKRILAFCIIPRGILEISEYLGYKDKKTVRKYLNPLISFGRIAMTIPDKPSSRFQKYVTIK